MLIRSPSVPVALWQRFLLPQISPGDDKPLQDQQARARDARLHQNLHDFEAFFARFARQITGYLWRMTSDEQTASDLCQETFFRAWQHFDQLRDRPEARGWLYRVATNLAAHHHRQLAAHPVEPLDAAMLGASDPGRRVAESERVLQVLQDLTPKQRSALVLHEVQGLSCDEIGQILQMSRDAVKMALFRAREQFRIRYLHEEDEA